MNMKTVSGIMLTMLLIGMLTLAFDIQLVKAEPTTIVVPDDYPTIQEAINNANEGDTIFVRAKTYYENIVINKNNLTLLGENKDTTIIDGSGAGDVIHVNASFASISGFTVQHGGDFPDSGIRVSGIPWTAFVDGVSITDNIIRDNGGLAGVYLIWSNNVVLSGNTITNATRTGIFIYFSANNSLCRNTIIDNRENGIYMFYSDGNVLDQNEVANNTYSGIYLYRSALNVITGCTITNHDHGIWVTRSNTFYHNNLANNIRQVGGYEHPSSWDDGYPSGGNYWSDYEERYPNATEIDGSGIWNTPYVIDENNQDNYPLMKPWMRPGVVADLVKRRAWSEHHHYDISKDEDEHQTLYAKVKNLGNQTVWVKAVFNITKDDGFSTVIESEPLLIETDTTVELAANFGPLTNADADKYYVSATCWYSHNKMVWRQGEKEKAFKFSIVS